MLNIFRSKNLIALFFFALFWLGIFIFSGSIFSGFHLTDDHEIVRIKNDLKTQNTLEVAEKWMKNDQLSTHRFRPFYFFHRVLETKAFGTNFTIWSIYTAILAILTSFFLFYFLRLLRFPFLESMLFPLLVLVGPQAAIWWRLGPNETLGIFLLSIALLFLGLSIVAKKYENVLKVLFVMFAILSSLAKESFLLMLPALILLLPYLSHEKENLSYKEALKRNAASMIALAIAFISFLMYVKIFIGTGGTGYAGVYGFNLKSYVMAFLQLAKNDHASIIAFIQIVLVFIFIWKRKIKNERIEILKKALYPTVLFFAILIPQVILYAKSGFFERYLVPAALAYAMAVIYLFGQIKKDNKVIWVGMILLTLFFIVGDARKSLKNAQDFAKEGRNIGNISNIIRLETSQENNFLIVGEPAANTEWADSINYYIRYELDRKNLYVYPIYKKASYSDFEMQLIKGFGGVYGNNRYETNIDKNYNVIIIFPKMEKTFLNNFPNQKILKSNSFARESYGGYVIYYRIKN